MTFGTSWDGPLRREPELSTAGQMAYRVLVLTSSYPTHPGSIASAFLADWSAALAARGHQLTVLTPEDADQPAVARQEGRVSIECFRYFPYSSLQTLAYGAGMYDNVLANPVRLAHLPAFLISLLRRSLRLAQGADITHAHWLFPAGLIGALVKQHTGTPLVVTVHSTDYHLLRRLPGGRILARAIARQADRLHFVTDHHRLLFTDWIGDAEGLDERSYVVPMGIADYLTAPPVWPLESPPRIGFLGRLIPLKGVDRLLRTCAALGHSAPTIAGAGPELQRLTSLAARLKVRAAFVGPLVGEQKTRFLDTCDILVFPSRSYRSGRSEGLPVSILEALARGRVVIASSAGGIPEIIRHADNGYIACARDDDSLTTTLGAVLRSWPHSAAVAAAARLTGTHLTASSLARQHELAYQASLPNNAEVLEERA